MVSVLMRLPYRPTVFKKRKSRVQALDFLFLSFDEIIVLGDTHNEINRIGEIEQ